MKSLENVLRKDYIKKPLSIFTNASTCLSIYSLYLLASSKVYESLGIEKIKDINPLHSLDSIARELLPLSNFIEPAMDLLETYTGEINDVANVTILTSIPYISRKGLSQFNIFQDNIYSEISKRKVSTSEEVLIRNSFLGGIFYGGNKILDMYSQVAYANNQTDFSHAIETLQKHYFLGISDLGKWTSSLMNENTNPNFIDNLNSEVVLTMGTFFTFLLASSLEIGVRKFLKNKKV